MKVRRSKIVRTFALSSAVLAVSTSAFAQVGPLTSGQKWLLKNGLQFHGMVDPAVPFNLAKYQGLNYTGINWMWDSNTAQQGSMPWARWVRNEAEMPPRGGTETPVINNLIGLQLGDEQDFNQQAVRDGMVTWLANARAAFPNALLYVNNYGGQLTDSSLGALASQVKPDMLSFDTYPFLQGQQPTGGQPWNWYSDMWRYRYFSLANDLLQGHYRQTFHDAGIRDVSESEMRLNTFGALAYNVKYTMDFTYNNGASSFFNTTNGDSGAPTAQYNYMAETNRQAKTFSTALSRLQPLNNHPSVSWPVTDMMFIRGRHSTGPGTDDLNALPWGFDPDPDNGAYSNWVYQQNDPYLNGWAVTNLGSKNSGLKGDVIISWFKPVDEWLDGDDWTNEKYLMVTNGLTDMNGTAAETQQQIVLDFVTMPTLQRVNRNTGAVEDVTLVPTSGKFRWTLTLDGGTSELFKFKDGAPFVGTLPQDTIWTNSAGGQFATGSNWDTGSAPSGSRFIHFGSTTSGSGPAYTVTFGGNVSATGVFVHRDAVTLNLNAKTFTQTGVDGVDSLIVGMKNGEASTLTVTNGTLATSAAAGYFSQIGKAAGATGTMTLGSGAVWNNSSDLLVGRSGNGTLNVNTGAVASLTNVYAGGSPTAAGNVLASGIVNIAGGTMNVSGTLKVWNSGSAAPGGTRINLSSGILNVGTLDTVSGASAARFNWTGGTLGITNSTFLVGTGGPLTGSILINGTKVLNVTNTLAITGTLSMFGGAVNANTITLSSAGSLARGSGVLTFNTFNHGGGTASFNGTSQMTVAAAGGANYNLSGGTLTVNNTLGIQVGTTAGNGTFTQTGGSVTTGSIWTGFDTGSSGTYALSAGTVSATNAYLGGTTAAAKGTGKLNQTGGTMSVSGTLKLWDSASSTLTLSAGTLNVGALDTSNNPSRLNWTGGTININNSSATVSPTGTLKSSLALAPGMNLLVSKPASSLSVASGSSLAVTGGSLNVLSLINDGTFTQTAGTSATGPISGTGAMAISGGGAIVVPSIRQQSLNLTGTGRVTVSTNGGTSAVARLGALTIGAGAKLDLNDNDLVVDSGTFSTLQQLVLTGYSATPDTNKTGIISTHGQTQSGTTILALFDNALAGFPEWPPGSGNSIATGAIVGKYTYIGDTNTDGQVTPQDYTAIDSNLGTGGVNPGIAWFYGDTNFDGNITAQDYTAVDSALGLGQGNPLAATSLTIAGTSVPEPGAAVLLIGATGAMMRRRRR
jgi:T5SS/PEP-CTERM-associated repeat protein